MWLIEFVDGHLNGICLPFEDSFSLTGNKDAQAKDLLSVPEYLSSNTELNFEVKDKKVQVSGLLRGMKIKQLKDNRIYRFEGTQLFCLSRRSRRPSLRRYRFGQYKPLITFSLVINIAAAITLYLGFINYQQSQVAQYLDVIESGYIKDGELIVFDKSAAARLPEFLQKNITLVESNEYFRTSRLDIELVSEYSGKSIAGRLVSKADRDEVVINTYERDNHIMALFGDYGLSFSKQDDY